MGRFSELYYGDGNSVPPSRVIVDNPTKESIKELLTISGNKFQSIQTNDQTETESLVSEVFNELGVEYGWNRFHFAPKTLRDFYRILAVTFTQERTIVMTIPQRLLLDPLFLPIIAEKVNGGRHIHGEHLPFTFDFEKYGVDHETARSWCSFDSNNYFLFMASAIEFGFPVNRKDFDDDLVFEFHKWMDTVAEDKKFIGRTMDDVNWVEDPENTECASYMDFPSKFFNLSRIVLIVPPNDTLN